MDRTFTIIQHGILTILDDRIPGTIELNAKQGQPRVYSWENCQGGMTTVAVPLDTLVLITTPKD